MRNQMVMKIIQSYDHKKGFIFLIQYIISIFYNIYSFDVNLKCDQDMLLADLYIYIKNNMCVTNTLCFTKLQKMIINVVYLLVLQTTQPY